VAKITGGLPKLDFEEEIILKDLVSSDAFSVILKVISHMHEAHKEAVLNYNLSNGPDGLVIKKAQSEGSAMLLQRVAGLKQYLRAKEQTDD
jgi:hypothetical protein